MKTFTKLLSSALLGWVLQSCCYGTVCDCFDECDDVIPIAFDTSVASGFTQEDIDTVNIYVLTKGQSTVEDTIVLLPDSISGCLRSSNWEMSFCAGGCKGFGLHPDNKAAHDYKIELPGVKTFTITKLVLEGRVSNRGCCHCYANTKKTLEVDGTFIDVKNSSGGDNTVILHR